MSRKPRVRSKYNMYHIMIRGNERKNIFLDDDDRYKFIDILYEKSKKKKYSLYAYCLMDNHVHLVINEKQEKISEIMKRINTSYAYYFNRKYKRVGHVFQDRFRSEPIEDERYLLAAIRYIHNNPVKASMVMKPEEYKWSSYSRYLSNRLKDGIIDKSFILGIFSKDKVKAIEFFIEFSSHDGDENFIDLEEVKNCNRIGDIEARIYVESRLKEVKMNIAELKFVENRQFRDEIIKNLRSDSMLSIRQIAKILGISKGIIEKVRA